MVLQYVCNATRHQILPPSNANDACLSSKGSVYTVTGPDGADSLPAPASVDCTASVLWLPGSPCCCCCGIISATACVTFSHLHKHTQAHNVERSALRGPCQEKPHALALRLGSSLALAWNALNRGDSPLLGDEPAPPEVGVRDVE